MTFIVLTFKASISGYAILCSTFRSIYFRNVNCLRKIRKMKELKKGGKKDKCEEKEK